MRCQICTIVSCDSDTKKKAKITTVGLGQNSPQCREFKARRWGIFLCCGTALAAVVFN